MGEAAPPLTVMAIAAVGRGPQGTAAIGRGGAIPWQSPADMAAFRAATLGHMVVMGATTYEGLPRRPLPGRVNYVLSRTPGSDPRWLEARRAGAAVVSSLSGLIHDLQRTCPPFAPAQATRERVADPVRRFPSGCHARDFESRDPLSRVLWVAGGAALYREALGTSGAPPLASRVILTEVDVDVPDADTTFPSIDPRRYAEIGFLDLKPTQGPGCVVREYGLRGDGSGLAAFLPRLALMLGTAGAGCSPA